MVRIYSLKGLLLGHNLAFLALIVVTGAMGWVAFELRQQSAEESLRLNNIVRLVQETRGDVYRQMTEVFDHHFLADPDAIARYRSSSARIADNFAGLEGLVRLSAEQAAIDSLRAAYRQVQIRTDGIMTTLSQAFREDNHITVFFTADLQMAWLDDYEGVFAAIDGLMSIAQGAEQARVDRVSSNVLLVVVIPIALALGLLMVSRVFLNRAFVRPLHVLLGAVAAYGRGRLDHKVPETGATELVTLERAINRMAEDLAHSREALVMSEKQAALGSLVPVVAHNIRNPLASIRAAAQLHDGGAVPADVAAAMRDIRGTVDRLEQWLGSLLSYLNPLHVARTDVNLTVVADEAIRLLQPRLDAKGLRVVREGWRHAPSAPLDIHLMEQALYGLLANAAEASPEGGTITLGARRKGDVVELSISDEGPGMPFRPSPDDLNPGPTTKSFGSGLGIPFAFKICDLHQGAMEFRSVRSGGTQVVITLPAGAGARSAAA